MASRGNSLFDDAAEESDDQNEEENNEQEDAEQQPKQRSGSQAGSDVDSSDEEEGGNEYDMTDKFIAPEDEEVAGESESDEEGGRRKKKKRRRREEEELDEEDYALLEEQGVRVDVCSIYLLAIHYAGTMHAGCVWILLHFCLYSMPKVTRMTQATLCKTKVKMHGMLASLFVPLLATECSYIQQEHHYAATATFVQCCRNTARDI